MSCPSARAVRGRRRHSAGPHLDDAGRGTAPSGRPAVRASGATFTGVSCPTVTLCVALDGVTVASPCRPIPRGIVSVALSPFVDGTGVMTAVSCVLSVVVCDRRLRGDVLTSTDPAGGGPDSWTVTHRRRPQRPRRRLLLKTGLCVRRRRPGRGGDLHRPTGGAAGGLARGRHRRQQPPRSPSPVPPVHFCVAGDDHGDVSPHRSDRGGGAWTVDPSTPTTGSSLSPVRRPPAASAATAPTTRWWAGALSRAAPPPPERSRPRGRAPPGCRP